MSKTKKYNNRFEGCRIGLERRVSEFGRSEAILDNIFTRKRIGVNSSFYWLQLSKHCRYFLEEGNNHDKRKLGVNQLHNQEFPPQQFPFKKTLV